LIEGGGERCGEQAADVAAQFGAVAVALWPGVVGCVASYDSDERVWNTPMPLLFQRRFGIEHRAIPAATIREWISGAFDGDEVTDAAGQPLRFTPHDFRRMFITDELCAPRDPRR
jgi:hypothetical protein